MLKKLIIIGASGFGREVAWLVERINKKIPTWDLIGFADDNEVIQNKEINGYSVIGTTTDLPDAHDVYVVCAIGASLVRKKIIDKIKNIYPNIKFATIIDPSVEMSDHVTIGEGSVICAHSILTTNIEIGAHVIINLDCTIGHDAVIHDFVTLYPSVNVSGMTEIGTYSELGTGMQIIQGKKIGANSVIGAGSVVIRDIPEKCTAVGNPAKPIKFFD